MNIEDKMLADLDKLIALLEQIKQASEEEWKCVQRVILSKGWAVSQFSPVSTRNYRNSGEAFEAHVERVQ